MIGACLAHYYPGKIDRVDFNRGNSPANKVANWEFVQKFLGRRGYSLSKEYVDCLCTVRTNGSTACGENYWTAVYQNIITYSHCFMFSGV